MLRIHSSEFGCRKDWSGCTCLLNRDCYQPAFLRHRDHHEYIGCFYSNNRGPKDRQMNLDQSDCWWYKCRIHCFEVGIELYCRWLRFDKDNTCPDHSKLEHPKVSVDWTHLNSCWSQQSVDRMCSWEQCFQLSETYRLDPGMLFLGIWLLFDAYVFHPEAVEFVSVAAGIVVRFLKWIFRWGVSSS